MKWLETRHSIVKPVEWTRTVRYALLVPWERFRSDWVQTWLNHSSQYSSSFTTQKQTLNMCELRHKCEDFLAKQISLGITIYTGCSLQHHLITYQPWAETNTEDRDWRLYRKLTTFKLPCKRCRSGEGAQQVLKCACQERIRTLWLYERLLSGFMQVKS